MSATHKDFLITIKGSLIIIGLVLLLGLVGDDLESEHADAARYCEMVTLYFDTAGQKGWPDFENRYEKDC